MTASTSAIRYDHRRLDMLIEHQGLRPGWFAEQLGQRVRGKGYEGSYVAMLRSGVKPITPAIAEASASILRIPVELLVATEVAPEALT